MHRSKWQIRIWSRLCAFPLTPSRATESHSLLVNQRKRLESSHSKVRSVFTRLPMVNELMRKIGDKKTRDNVIVAFVMACCIFFCIWYILHSRLFNKHEAKSVLHIITRTDKRRSLPQAGAASQPPPRSLRTAGPLRTGRRLSRADGAPLLSIAEGPLLAPRQEGRSPQHATRPRSELGCAGDTPDE